MESSGTEHRFRSPNDPSSPLFTVTPPPLREGNGL
jgi:hypothetical protein